MIDWGSRAETFQCQPQGMETAQAIAAPSPKALGQQSYAARLIIKASNLQPQFDSCGGYRAATLFIPKVACATSPSRPLTKKSVRSCYCHLRLECWCIRRSDDSSSKFEVKQFQLSCLLFTKAAKQPATSGAASLIHACACWGT